MEINKLYKIRKSYFMYFPPIDMPSNQNTLYPKNHLKFIKGMKKVLTRYGFEDICKKYLPESFNKSFQDSDINELEKRIYLSIEKSFKNNFKNQDIVEEIFHAIQLWGGVHGRWIYQTKSFKNNFNINLYISFCKFYFMQNQLISDHVQNIENLCKMANMNIPFATRHAKFWASGNTKKNHSLIPCVYDQGVREMITMGFGGPNTKHKKNLHELNALWLIQKYLCNKYSIDSNKFDLLIRLHSSDFRKIDYSKFLKFEVTNTGNIYQHD